MAKIQKRKPVNLSIRADVLADVKAYNINASAVSESALIEAVKKTKEEAWIAENLQAINAYNKRVDKEGLSLKSDWMDDGAV